MRFNFKYFVFTALLFITDSLIGIYVHDAYIRPFGGDFLVVILLYCFVRSFFNVHVLITAISVLIFAYIIEISQYFHLINLLGLQNSTVARLVLGSSFSWVDMLMYTLGIILVVLMEMFLEIETQAK